MLQFSLSTAIAILHKFSYAIFSFFNIFKKFFLWPMDYLKVYIVSKYLEIFLLMFKN